MDVRELRSKLNLSQNEFASRFGISPAVIRNWEQGRNAPDGTARILLAVIASCPQVVADAVHFLVANPGEPCQSEPMAATTKRAGRPPAKSATTKKASGRTPASGGKKK